MIVVKWNMENLIRSLKQAENSRSLSTFASKRMESTNHRWRRYFAVSDYKKDLVFTDTDYKFWKRKQLLKKHDNILFYSHAAHLVRL